MPREVTPNARGGLDAGCSLDLLIRRSRRQRVAKKRGDAENAESIMKRKAQRRRAIIQRTDFRVIDELRTKLARDTSFGGLHSVYEEVFIQFQLGLATVTAASSLLEDGAETRDEDVKGAAVLSLSEGVLKLKAVRDIMDEVGMSIGGLAAGKRSTAAVRPSRRAAVTS